MRWLKMLVVLLLVIAIGFVGIMFTIHNTQKVTIDLVVLTLPEASLSLWLIAAFVVGGLAGFVLSGVAIVSLKTRLMSARRKMAANTKELDKLRTAALKDAT